MSDDNHLPVWLLVGLRRNQTGNHIIESFKTNKHKLVRNPYPPDRWISVDQTATPVIISTSCHPTRSQANLKSLQVPERRSKQIRTGYAISLIYLLSVVLTISGGLTSCYASSQSGQSDGSTSQATTSTSGGQSRIFRVRNLKFDGRLEPPMRLLATSTGEQSLPLRDESIGASSPFLRLTRPTKPRLEHQATAAAILQPEMAPSNTPNGPGHNTEVDESEQVDRAASSAQPRKQQVQSNAFESILSLADEFDSKIITNRTKAQLSCDSGEMILRLNFSEPFRGIVYPDHNRLSPCRFFGDGHFNYELRLPLRGCGTRQAAARVFVNDVIVRFHKSLELEEDEVKTVICRYPPPQAPIPIGQPEEPSGFELLDGRLKNEHQHPLGTVDDGRTFGSIRKQSLLEERISGTGSGATQPISATSSSSSPPSSGQSSGFLERLSSIELLFLISTLLFLALLALGLAAGYLCFRRQRARRGLMGGLSVGGPSHTGHKRRHAHQRAVTTAGAAAHLLRGPKGGTTFGGRNDQDSAAAAAAANSANLLRNYNEISGQLIGLEPPSPDAASEMSSARRHLLPGATLPALRNQRQWLQFGPSGSTYDRHQHEHLQRHLGHSRALPAGNNAYSSSTLQTRRPHPVVGRREAAALGQRPYIRRSDLEDAANLHRARQVHLSGASTLRSSRDHGGQQKVTRQDFGAEWSSQLKTRYLDSDTEPEMNNNNKHSLHRGPKKAVDQSNLIRTPRLLLKSIEDSYITKFTEVQENDYRKRDSTRPLQMDEWRRAAAEAALRTQEGRSKVARSPASGSQTYSTNSTSETSANGDSSSGSEEPEDDQKKQMDDKKRINHQEINNGSVGENTNTNNNMRSLTELDVVFARPISGQAASVSSSQRRALNRSVPDVSSSRFRDGDAETDPDLILSPDYEVAADLARKRPSGHDSNSVSYV